jgi:hypothetical protein
MMVAKPAGKGLFQAGDDREFERQSWMPAFAGMTGGWVRELGRTACHLANGVPNGTV